MTTDDDSARWRASADDGRVWTFPAPNLYEAFDLAAEHFDIDLDEMTIRPVPQVPNDDG